MNNKPMKHDQIHNIPSQSLYLQATMTILPQNRVRLIAIPVFLCASWFLDFTKLIDSLRVETTQGTHHVRKKSNPIRIDNNNKTTMPSLFQDGIHNAAKQALHTVSVDDEQDLGNKKPLSWYDTNTAVQELEKALSESLTLEERQLWHDTPNFHPFPKRISCPSPKPFVSSNVPITLLDFTDEQKDTLRQQLEQGSSTIRKAFAPWIEKEGFHPDLILHGGKVAGHMVGILDGKLYFWGDKHSHAKIRLLAEHLESVLYEFHKRNVQIPDVMFPYSVRSIPPDSLTKNCARGSAVPSHLQDRYDAVPVAGIAMDPTIHTGIALMPNMYFGNLQVWDRYTKELLGKLNTPWNKRKKRVFWRGKIDKNLYHNAPRLEALQAAARDLQSSNGKNRNFDVRLTSGCGYLKNFAKNVTRTSPLAPKWLPRDYFIKVTECGGYTRTPHAKFPNYWAQLNLPGSSLGSYSKNLQNLWPMGAAVMIWNQSAVEFYYDSLKPGVTHIWVNETNVEATATKLFENDGKLAQLYGNVGREWFQQHLTADAILDYYQEWFHAWSALQRFVPTKDVLLKPCTCSGWVDANGESNGGVKRCQHCTEFPRPVQEGCLEMMGIKSSTSLCK